MHDITADSNCSVHDVNPMGRSLPNNDFVPLDDVIANLSKPWNVADEIPTGRKENVMFVVNTRGFKFKDTYKYWDDCGQWQDTRSQHHYYLCAPDATRKTVHKTKDGYKVRHQEHRSIRYIRLEPQPPADHMLVVRRYYASSKANKNCKRRITTLLNIPTHFDFPKESLQYSLVEYIEKCTATLQHGNAKLRQAPYVRSHPKVHENIRDALQKKKRPRDIYIDMLQNDDVHQTAKRIRQIHDAKKQMKEKESGGQRASTFADEVQQVLSMMDDPASVVQYVFFAKSKSPCFILYTPQCMASLKSNCFRTITPSILGIDKTSS